MITKPSFILSKSYLIITALLFIIFACFGEYWIISHFQLQDSTVFSRNEIEDVVVTKYVNDIESLKANVIMKPYVDLFNGNTNHTFDIVLCSNFMDSHDPLKLKIQFNTLKRFAEFDRSKVKFVLFTTSQYWIKHANRFNIEVSTEFTTNQYGTPYFFPMLQYIETHYDSHFYGFLNGDILLHSNIISALQTVWDSVELGQLKQKVMITGRRNNIYIKLSTTIGNNNDEIDSFISTSIFMNEQFLPVSQDYFIITHDTFDYEHMLNVVIGRNTYDNYIVDYCYHRSSTISLIDASNSIIALHQTESHGNFAGERINPDKTWNHDIIQDKHDHDSVLFANWRLYTTVSNRTFVLRASPFDDNFNAKEKQFLIKYLNTENSCFYLGSGYISGEIASICSTAQIVYYDKWYSKKIHKYVKRPALDSEKYHEEIRIIDVYNKTMVGECSRYHFYFDRLVELQQKFDVIFVDGGCRLHALDKIVPYLKDNGFVVFRGYNLQKYDYSSIIEEAYTQVAELKPDENMYSTNILGIHIYQHIPNKYITTELPM